jgi:hypothetical protein
MSDLTVVFINNLISHVVFLEENIEHYWVNNYSTHRIYINTDYSIFINDGLAYNNLKKQIPRNLRKNIRQQIKLHQCFQRYQILAGQISFLFNCVTQKHIYLISPVLKYRNVIRMYSLSYAHHFNYKYVEI